MKSGLPGARWPDGSLHLLSQLRDGILVLDAQGSVRLINAEASRITGVTGSGALSLTPDHLLDFPEYVRLFLLEIGEGKEPPSDREVEGLLPNGGKVRVSLGASCISDRKGGHLGHVVLMRDVTGTREVETPASHTQRLAALGEMAGAIAHEIRNPLNIIMGYAQQIAEITTDPQLQRYAGTLVDEVQRLDGIVGNVLEYQRKEQRYLTSGDLNQVVAAVLEFYSLKMTTDRVEAHWDPDPTLPHVQFNRDKMKQLFLNLIINAAQAMPQGGVLRVTSRRRMLMSTADPGTVAQVGRDLSGHEVAEVCVTDGGSGIAPNAIGHLFDPFFTTKSMGTGLGLSVCAKIVSDHDGMLVAGNSKEGGAFFSVRLPSGK